MGSHKKIPNEEKDKNIKKVEDKNVKISWRKSKF